MKGTGPSSVLFYVQEEEDSVCHWCHFLYLPVSYHARAASRPDVDGIQFNVQNRKRIVRAHYMW